jgi:hypothetical protein
VTKKQLSYRQFVAWLIQKQVGRSERWRFGTPLGIPRRASEGIETGKFLNRVTPMFPLSTIQLV